jgi:hypothetical protein
MELQRIGIKLFADSSAPIPVRDFIPVFHSWIQKQAIERHLLVDVHNYSHIHHGPGILLVAQEGNFSIDMADGRMGLLYYRKKSGSDIASVLKTAFAACRLLESDTAFGGRLRFRSDEMWIVANDRLLVPNDDPTFEQLKPSIAAALKLYLPEGKFKYTRSSVNPKDRLAIHVQAG